MLSMQEQLKEYDRVVAMCKGTKFECEEYKCIKVKYYNEDNYDAYNYSNKPAMDQQYDRIFAIAIVDDTPIWLEEPFILYQTNTNLEYSYRKQDNKLVGVYRDSNNCKVLTAIIPMENVIWEYFTLTKPDAVKQPYINTDSITDTNTVIQAEPTKISKIDTNDVDSRQVGGSHYKTKGIQPWAYMEANFTKEEFVGFLRGNAHKYLDRYKDKNGIEDLKKAIHYIEKLIQVEDK